MSDLYATGAVVGPPHYDPFWDDIDRGHGPMYFSHEGIPISFREWGLLFESEERIIAQDYVLHEQRSKGGFWISTVWLGLDHGGWWSGGPPLIFESMAFLVRPARWNEVVLRHGGNRNLPMDRYSTEEGAKLGHNVMVEEARRMLSSRATAAR